MATNRLGGVLGRLREAAAGAGADRLPDQELLDRFVGRRDPAAFEAILARHGPMVLSVCRRALADPASAEDAFQATFLVLLTKAGSVGRGELLGNWLYGVACRTAARARVEAAKRRTREALVPAKRPPDPLAEITGRELLVALDEEVLRLPLRYRAPVVLCYLEGKTRDEAATELGWSPATLGRRLGRGRDLLRARLARRGLALSAALLPAALAGGSLTAGVPGPLAAPVLRAATLVAGGKAVPAGVVPAEVETLSRRVVGAMFVAKLKTTAAVLLAASFLAIGVGTLSHRALQGQPAKVAGDPPKAAQPPAERPKGAAPRDHFSAVLDTVKGVENKTERVVLLIRVAQGKAGAGDKDGARVILREALELADGLDGETPRGMALREIATTRLRLGDVEEATAVAGKFKDESHRNHLLFLLAHEQAGAGDIRGARKTADLITDDQKDGALDAVGRAEARSGDVDAARKTADALKHQPLSRAGVLEELALAQAKKGDRKGAAASLQEALRLNDTTLADAKNRNGARAEIAVKQARIGDVEGALRAAAALEIDRESGYHDRVYALRQIAVEQVRQGDTPGALKTLRDIPDDSDRVRALLGLAEAQADGKDRAGAEKTLAAARDLAEKTPDPGKGDLIDDIGAARANVQLKAGDVKGALETGRALKHDRLRCWVFLDVARAQAKAGDRKAARATLALAMKAADGFPEGEENQGCHHPRPGLGAHQRQRGSSGRSSRRRGRGRRRGADLGGGAALAVREGHGLVGGRGWGSRPRRGWEEASPIGRPVMRRRARGRQPATV